MSRREFWKKQLLMPQLLATGALLGMFHWTNYWDFVIYFVVTCGAALFMNIIGQKGKIRWALGVTAAQAAEILILATVIILPFTLQFDTSNMVQGIALATASFSATSASGALGTAGDFDNSVCSFSAY